MIWNEETKNIINYFCSPSLPVSRIIKRIKVACIKEGKRKLRKIKKKGKLLMLIAKWTVFGMWSQKV